MDFDVNKPTFQSRVDSCTINWEHKCHPLRTATNHFSQNNTSNKKPLYHKTYNVKIPQKSLSSLKPKTYKPETNGKEIHPSLVLSSIWNPKDIKKLHVDKIKILKIPQHNLNLIYPLEWMDDGVYHLSISYMRYICIYIHEILKKGETFIYILDYVYIRRNFYNIFCLEGMTAHFFSSFFSYLLVLRLYSTPKRSTLLHLFTFSTLAVINSFCSWLKSVE